ncbi:MAG: SGNH/GDSL hydrolase family protein [Gemmatimonadaceae bacterium]|nr:SGNH/GDSL hydrolase family protein [Gemmatimonadaceae bacterium]
MKGPKKRSKSGRKRKNQADALLASTIQGGEQAGTEVLLVRARVARRRQKAARLTRTRNVAAIQAGRLAIPERTRSMLSLSARTGTLMAEGDSWFDYPMHDVLSMLEDDYGYNVESVAHRGDRIEDMAYSGGQAEAFARRLEKLLRANEVPRAILLSGGGNDIAGDQFSLLLNHAASPLPATNDDIVRGVIDVRMRDAYAHMISGLTTITKGYLDVPLPIVVHGYAHPVPDGRGFMGGWSLLPGPWLRPGFVSKGHVDQSLNTKVTATLIDRFNNMMETLVSLPAFNHVHFVDLRTELRNDGGYREHWANELHPTKAGFKLVTAKLAARVASL